MTLAILCSYPESPYARRILAALNARGLRGVHVIAGVPPEDRSLAALWRRYGAGLPRAAVAAARRRLRRALVRRAPAGPSLPALVAAQAGRYLGVPGLNDAACVAALAGLAPDLVLLGGSPILRAPVLGVPRLGTLNAHQGLLPRYRGMNVLEWTLLEGGEPTLTVHFVDPGVDTGDIVQTEPVPLRAGESLAELKQRAAAQQADLLSRAAVAAAAGSLPRRPQTPAEGRQYFVMHPALRAHAAACLAVRQHAIQATRRRRRLAGVGVAS